MSVATRKPSRKTSAKETSHQPLPGQMDFTREEDLSSSQRLKLACRAIRVRFSTMARQRQIPQEHKEKLAQTVAASGKSLSASKKLFDAKNPYVQAVNAAIAKINALVTFYGYPHPEASTWLIREEQIPEFRTKFDELRGEFFEAVNRLAENFEDVKRQAAGDLGQLFNPADYADPRTSYNVTLDFPNVDPPSYLKQLDPKLYEEQYNRMMADFEAASAMMQAEFTEAMSNAVNGLVAALQGFNDGTQKCFTDNTATKIFSLFEEFQNKLSPLGIGKGSQVSAVLDRAREVMRGQNEETIATALRKSKAMRLEMIDKLGSIGETLSSLTESSGGRLVLKRRQAETAAT